MARGKEIDKAAAELVLSMKERNPGLTTEQIGDVMQCDATTAGRIIRCGSWEAYCEWKKEKARKEREKNRKPEVKLVYDGSIIEEYRREQREKAEEQQPEEQVPGQICMELEPEKKELSEQVKMMRFVAGQVDKLYMKLETLNDTLSQILRAVRKE